MEYNDYELIYMVNEDEEAFSVLMDKYTPLFKKVSSSAIRYCFNKGLDFDDLMQQCRVTFCYVLDRYDYRQDVLFYTYLLICLRRSLFKYIRGYVNKPDCYNYMDLEEFDNVLTFSSDTDVSSYYDDYLYEVDIINFKNTLDSIESSVFELRYNGFSYKDIAVLLDINFKKVDNCLLKIRKKLEKYFLFS